MKEKLVRALFGLIIVLALVLRFWDLGKVPPSPDWDEVALGYDAYSFIHTARDEYGNFLPPVLRSFDDYKPALYAYLAVPAVYLFGLSTVAVRIPSALFGVIATIAVFYLVRELFEKYKYKDQLSLLAAFLFAISPWSIQFSRVAFEANIGMTLNILAVLFFIRGLKKPWMLYLAAAAAGLSIYAYQSEKIFVPLLVLALVIIFAKKLFALPKKHIVIAIIVGLIVVAPMVAYIIANPESLLRARGTSIFSYPTETLSSTIPKLERDAANSDALGLFLDNRRFVYAKTIISGYLSHFDPTWLAIAGDISRHNAPFMGYLYLFELPFILVGIYLLIFGDFDRKTKLVILLWLLIAPIPASFTVEVPHPVRTLNFLPTFQILAAIGIFCFFSFISKLKSTYVKYIVFSFCLLFLILNISYYLNQYFVQQNYYSSAQWQYGYEEATGEVARLQDKYSEVIVSDVAPLDKSYMFFLFYLKYDPAKYQEVGKFSSGSFAAHHAFDKYKFRPIDWKRDSKLKNALIMGSDDEIPDGAALKTIHNLDGSVAIKIAGT